MTGPALVAGLAERGVNISARDGRLVIDAPTGVLTEDDLSELARLKPELLDLLSAPPETTEAAWPPRRAELASWPIPDRQTWGERSNALIDTGMHWKDAERQAFHEVLDARRFAGLADFGTEAERAVDETGVVLTLNQA